MLVLFLFQDNHNDKLYSDPSDFITLLCNAMPSSSTTAATLDITPPSPTSSSRKNRHIPTTPPKDGATNASLQVQDTPLVIKQSGKVPHSSMTDPKADSRNVTLARESLGSFVGPVSARYFFRYLPEPEKAFTFDEKKAKQYAEKIRQAAKNSERDMYAPFLEMMEDMIRSGGSTFKIVQTANQILSDFFGSEIMPDFVIQENHGEKNGAFQSKHIEVMIELKHRKRFDPFVDDSKDQVEGTTDKSQHSLGQSVSYAACHQSMQARTFVFQVLVIEDYARLLRWDRSGAIVTCKIPLSDKNFFEFFWRFCHLTPEQRGWDTTMKTPSPEETKIAKSKLEAAEKEVGIDGGSQYFGKISLGQGTYIVHRIFLGTQSPFGRGTRGYAAYREKDDKVVFLKSTWRVVGEGRKPEHEIYAALHAAEVQHIPTVVEYLEVENHVTKTQDTPESWRRDNVKDLRTFQHYMIVFEELCRPIEKFESRKQLLTAFADAADAHQQALDKAMMLHRDVSAGNILITKNGSGLLGDWEMAKHVDDIKRGGSQPERTGTFQFLSARFVSGMYDFGPHDRKDDIESFFHTLQWIVLRFVDHGMDPIGLGGTLHQTFDATSPGHNGVVVCGGRLSSVQNSMWVNCKNFKGVLRVLLEKLRKTINSRYFPSDEMDRAKQMYVHYRKVQDLQQQLRLDPALDKTEFLAAMQIAAEPAILYYEQLEDTDWFQNHLRQAANEQWPPGEASTPQHYEPVQLQGTKKTKKFEAKGSCRENYERPASKRLKLDRSLSKTRPESASENPDETDYTSSKDDSDDSYQPRTRKTPHGKA